MKSNERWSGWEVGNLGRSKHYWGDIRRDIEHLIRAGLEFVLARSDESYPFIDTKLNLHTGEDFTDSLRGREAVYTWIQGRGLEALSVHIRWLSEREDFWAVDLSERTRDLVRKVVSRMEVARTAGGGRLPFLMNPNGIPLKVGQDGEVSPDPGRRGDVCSLSDLFYAKGLLGAGDILGDALMVKRAKVLFQSVVDDLRTGRFIFGQIALDPKNPVSSLPGRRSYAGQMIGIGAATLFYRVTGDPCYRDLGLEFIDHILQKHAGENLGLEEGDVCEFITLDNMPWRSGDGRVWSDPGHAAEFVGLAQAHLLQTNTNAPFLFNKLAAVLRKNFANGFAGRGIVKAYDLVERRVINSDMPWWSLPETMRAAALTAVIAGLSKDETESEWEAIFVKCWQAFSENFILPHRGFLAWQCLDIDGKVSCAIPATPDLDPAYHTGLSLLGCLPWLRGKAALGELT